MDAGIEVYGISRDDVAKLVDFADEQGFTYTLLSDTSGEVCRAYGTCGSAPNDKAQRITYIIGRDGTILHAFGDVDAAEHAGIALDFLAQADS